MIKPAITVLLALLCLLLLKANIDAFRSLPLSREIEMASPQKGSAKKIRTQQPLNLNPTLSPQLPDLNSGYIFNAQRFLAKDSRIAKAGLGLGQNIRIEDVVFNGALLGEGYKIALVSYSLAPNTRVRVAGNRRSQTPDQKSSGTVQLKVGDEIGGYTVKEITADFITFMKGSDTIKKTLFDPNKNRQLLAPRPASTQAPRQSTPAVAPSRRITPPSATKP